MCADDRINSNPFILLLSVFCGPFSWGCPSKSTAPSPVQRHSLEFILAKRADGARIKPIGAGTILFTINGGHNLTELTTEQLQALQAEADRTLDAILESVEGNSELQSAVREIILADGLEVPTFERLIAEEPAVANQVLFSAVGALANLQALRTVKKELSKRAAVN